MTVEEIGSTIHKERIRKGLSCRELAELSSLKLDPALMASPMITTVVDMSSLFIYFSIAKAVLKI